MRVARVLMGAGVVLAAAGAGAWVLDVIPPMPEWMLRIAVYKLTLFAGASMLVAGAALRRALTQVRRREQALRRDDPAALGQGMPPTFTDVSAQRGSHEREFSE